jgi:MFS transporter, OFA family, oxalate/formate antiporter
MSHHKFRNIPFSPAKWPFFYGWVIIFAGILGILMSIPGQTIGVSVFTDHLISSLNIGRVNLSTAYMIGTVLSGFLIPFAGRLYDKYGVRPVVMTAGFMLGATLFYLSSISGIASSVSGFTGLNDPYPVMFVLITAGFFLLRFFGQGVLTMASRNMVMKWFDKRRGFANAILGITTSFGFSYSPRVIDMLIQRNTWQGTWLLLGLVAMGFVFFAFLFFRDNPGKYGLLPDGTKVVRKKKHDPNLPLLREYDLKQAISTYSFWIFNLALSLQSLYITAFTFNVISIFSVKGFDSSVALAIFLPSSFVAVIFHFAGSWLSDYLKLKYFLILQTAGMIISMSALLILDLSPLSKWILIIGNGIMNGMYGILTAVTWPRFFGLKHLGAISGYSMGWMVIASAIGPFSFSLSYRYTGEYDPAVWICILIAVILFFLAFRAENVNRS